MNLDFEIDNIRFNARASAIIYNKDKTKVLLFKIVDRDYFMLPGGRIEIYEDSLNAVKREIKEEASRKAWETRRRKKDQADYNRIKSNREWQQTFHASRLVWNKVQSMIANVGVQQSQSADLLNNVLNSEIEKYGADSVLYSIAQASEDFLSTCEVIIKYHPSSSVSRAAVQHLYTLISGSLPSDAEQAEIDKAIANDEMWEEYAKRCIACGRCNFSCPTCSCFTTVDYSL